MCIIHIFNLRHATIQLGPVFGIADFQLAAVSFQQNIIMKFNQNKISTDEFNAILTFAKGMPKNECTSWLSTNSEDPLTGPLLVCTTNLSITPCTWQAVIQSHTTHTFNIFARFSDFICKLQSTRTPSILHWIQNFQNLGGFSSLKTNGSNNFFDFKNVHWWTSWTSQDYLILNFLIFIFTQFSLSESSHRSDFFVIKISFSLFFLFTKSKHFLFNDINFPHRTSPHDLTSNQGKKRNNG